MNPYISDIIYCCEPFDKYHAFVDLQNLGKYSEGRVVIAERVLASRWMWSLGKVRRFLDDLRQHQCISITKSTKQNIITLIPYDADHINQTDKEERAQMFCDIVNNDYSHIAPDIREQFIAYWLEWSPRTRLYRFERTENFDMSERLAYWLAHNNKSNNNKNAKQNGKLREQNPGSTYNDEGFKPITIADLK